MDNYIVRLAEKNDIKSVQELQVQWCNENITYGFVPGGEEYLSSKLGEYFFVAEKDTEVIGFVYGTVHEASEMAVFIPGEKYLETDDIYISNSYRNTGVGGMLLNAVFEAAKGKGIERSYVYSATKDSERIINFYKEHGYKTWCIQMFK
jgi:GNAT superfamily N-acetyltransferase